MKILVVEDDPDTASSLSAILAASGHTDVACAPSREAAVAALGLDEPPNGNPGEPFDLVLLDLGLPDGDGMTLCRRIRRHGRLRNIPVIVVTARDDESSVENAFEAGAKDYVVKPVRVRELQARVRSALRSKIDKARRVTREEQLRELTESLRRSNHDLERLTLLDPLTGIPNRRHFNVAYLSEWRRTSRYGTWLSVVMTDLDQFHLFNERYGHLAGDECLRRVSTALAAVARRPSDLLARYGGEEFVFVLPDTDPTGALAIAERARDAVFALCIPHEAAGDTHGHVSISAGTSSLIPRPDLAPETLIDAADEALFEAKRRGRNRVCATRQGADTTNVVVVDPILARRIPGFLANRRQDVQAILQAIQRGAFDDVQRMGHNLKGIGASYGFDPISELGKRVEEAAIAHDSAAINAAAQELAAYLHSVRVAPAESGHA